MKREKQEASTGIRAGGAVVAGERAMGCDGAVGDRGVSGGWGRGTGGCYNKILQLN